jgi:trimeric autotransporter adhesin
MNAGTAITTGINNVLIGGLAGDALTDADYNTSVGGANLSSDTLGSKSTAIGYGALVTQNFTTATDSFNVAVGYNAGTAVTTGIQNTFVGGLSGDGTNDGSYNTAVGTQTLSANAGDENTAIGYNALAVCTGSNNTACGTTAGLAVSSGSNNLLLGNDAGRTGSPGGNIATGSNEMVLGDENITNAYIQVDWTVSSDQRDKTDFTALDLGLDFVKALAPVTYKWDKRSKYGDKKADDYDLAAQTPDGTHKEDWLDIGFKAQEVEALEIAAGYKIADKTNLVTSLTSDGKQYGMQYSKFVPILVKAIQELEARVKELEG